MQEPVPGIQAIPDEQNARYFHVVVAGPSDVSLLEDRLALTDTHDCYFSAFHLLRIFHTPANK